MRKGITVSQLLRILLIGWKRVEPEEFFNKWIPRLYGIHPGEDRFKEACIEEVTRHMPEVTWDNAYKNWRWGKDVKKPYYPKHLPTILTFLDREYTILEKLGHLPRYELKYRTT